MLSQKDRKLSKINAQIKEEQNKEKLPKGIKTKPFIPDKFEDMEYKENFENHPEIPFNQKITANDENTKIYNIYDLHKREINLKEKYVDLDNKINLINTALGNLYNNVGWEEFRCTINNSDRPGFGFIIASSDENRWNNVITNNKEELQFLILEFTLKMHNAVLNLSQNYSNKIFAPDKIVDDNLSNAVIGITAISTTQLIDSSNYTLNSGLRIYWKQNSASNNGIYILNNVAGGVTIDSISSNNPKIYVRKKDFITESEPTNFLLLLKNQFQYHSEFSENWGSSSEKENRVIKAFLQQETTEWKSINFSRPNATSLKTDLIFSQREGHNSYFSVQKANQNLVILCDVDKNKLKQASTIPSKFFNTLFMEVITNTKIQKFINANTIELYQSFLFSLFTNVRSKEWVRPSPNPVSLNFWDYKIVFSPIPTPEPKFEPIKIDHGNSGVEDGWLRFFWDIEFKDRLTTKWEYINDKGAEVHNILTYSGNSDNGNYVFEELRRSTENMNNNIHNIPIKVKVTTSCEDYDDYVFEGNVPARTRITNMVYGWAPTTKDGNSYQFNYMNDNISSPNNRPYELYNKKIIEGIDGIWVSGSSTGNGGEPSKMVYSKVSIVKASDRTIDQLYTAKFSPIDNDNIMPLTVYGLFPADPLQPNIDYGAEGWEGEVRFIFHKNINTEKLGADFEYIEDEGAKSSINKILEIVITNNIVELKRTTSSISDNYQNIPIKVKVIFTYEDNNGKKYGATYYKTVPVRLDPNAEKKVIYGSIPLQIQGNGTIPTGVIVSFDPKDVGSGLFTVAPAEENTNVQNIQILAKGDKK